MAAQVQRMLGTAVCVVAETEGVGKHLNRGKVTAVVNPERPPGEDDGLALERGGRPPGHRGRGGLVVDEVGRLWRDHREQVYHVEAAVSGAAEQSLGADEAADRGVVAVL